MAARCRRIILMVAGRSGGRQGTVSEVRRSFRMGLWLGLLAGLVVAILKVVQTRRQGSEREPAEWPPFQPSTAPPSTETQPLEAADPVATAEPTLAAVRPEPAVDETPAPPRARAPVKKAAKKVAKAPATKKAAKKAVKAVKAVKKAAARKAAGGTQPATPGVAWVEPDDGLCPSSHPIKAKLSSGLFHMPGMAFYNRTRADRCYADEESAVQDGLTRAKR